MALKVEYTGSPMPMEQHAVRSTMLELSGESSTRNPTSLVKPDPRSAMDGICEANPFIGDSYVGLSD